MDAHNTFLIEEIGQTNIDSNRKRKSAYNRVDCP